MSGQGLESYHTYPWPVDLHAAAGPDGENGWNVHIRVALDCMAQSFIANGLMTRKAIAVTTSPDVTNGNWNHALRLLLDHYSTAQTDWSTWHKEKLPDHFVAASVFFSFLGGETCVLPGRKDLRGGTGSSSVPC